MEYVLQNIKNIRQQKGITHAKMAEALGLSRVQYTNIEAGSSGLTMDRMQGIADVLEIDIEQLMRKPQAKVISFVNRKGGVGKSTITVLFAAALCKWTSLKVLVVDTDSQATVSGIASKGASMDVCTVNFDESHTPIRDFLKLIDKKVKEYDVILIDTQGSFSDSQATNTILSISDVCVVPIQATAPAVQSTMSTLVSLPDIAEARKKEGKGFIALGAINQKTRTNEHKVVANLHGKFGLKLLSNSLSNLVRYHRELSLETSICGKDENDEFVDFFNELVKEIGL